MINTKKFKNILYSDYGIILNESEVAYINYLSKTSNKSDYGILKEFFTKCTTRHLCVENNKKDLKDISKKIIKEGPHSHSSSKNIHGSINAAGVVDTEKFLRKEEIVDIEEITDTVQGKEGIMIDDGNQKETKYFDTQEEKNVYQKNLENKYLTSEIDEQLHSTRRIGGTYGF